MPKHAFKICLTGGGTAGHVMPHLALLPEIQRLNWHVFYLGSYGMERDLIAPTHMKYYAVSSGKLRRYLSIENFFDVFKILIGFIQSIFILLRERPDVVFSKGGFVSVPVCYAAKLLHIPVVTHESDLTPGLATRLIAKVAARVLYAFEESARYFVRNHASCVGAILRQDIFTGSKERGLNVCGFRTDDPRPVVLVMGGSLGAQRINDALAQAGAQLCKSYRIVHLTGKGKGIPLVCDGYKAFEFLGGELKDVFAATDLILARAGANSIFEFLALRKPMLLIPLEIGSRGDQVHNAKSFEQKGWAMTLREADLSSEQLAASLDALRASASSIRIAMEQSPTYSLDKVLAILANP